MFKFVFSSSVKTVFRNNVAKSVTPVIYGRLLAVCGRTWQQRCWASRASAAATNTLKEPDMFCYQCEQTKSRRGCVTVGVCGKSATVAQLQDMLMYALYGLSMHANRAINLGLYASAECDDFLQRAMFSTLTNVNFDPDRFPVFIQRAVQYRDEIRSILEENAKKQGKPLDEVLNQAPANYTPENYDVDYLASEGKKVGVLSDQAKYGTDINGVRYMTLYGIRGLSAYSVHAACLGEHDPWVPKFIYQTLDWLMSGSEEARFDLVKNLEVALKVGDTNIRVMELLDLGHRRQLGTPSPRTVQARPIPGKCILISGHDMMDLYTLLKATEGTDINVYTHGEMLPAHSYPNLNKSKNLVGHFGGAWQNQKVEFALFPGPVLASTNCVVEPMKSYRDRLYTLNETGIHGVKHLDLHDAEQVQHLLEHAMSLPGFDAKMISRFDKKEMTTGFSRETIVGQADKILEAIGNGQLSRVCVIGGCDGSEHKRNYFTNVATALPPQSLILTMGCAKFRITSLDLGELGTTGIPRILDMGQCNDSYGAVMVAKALASALDTDINSLPLSINLSWFEQKAVAVLLSLLSLGIKNIKLGPVMPAFMTPTVQAVLKEKFGLEPVDIRHPDEDMEDMMQYQKDE